MDTIGVIVFLFMILCQTIHLIGVGFRSNNQGFSSYLRIHTKYLLRWAVPWLLATIVFAVAYLNGGDGLLALMMGMGLAATVGTAGVLSLENKSKLPRK